MLRCVKCVGLTPMPFINNPRHCLSTIVGTKIKKFIIYIYFTIFQMNLLYHAFMAYLLQFYSDIAIEGPIQMFLA